MTMPRGQYAKPFNTGRDLRDLQGLIPHVSETVECPVYHKTFDRFPTIELLDEQTTGEIDFFCPYCDTLLFKEFRTLDNKCFEIVDPDHKLIAK